MYSAIPTLYRGIRFRSRLEATWAAMFDDLGWPWQYEPLDLKGYIPDFIIGLVPHLPVLVEVKPGINVEELQEYTPKIEKSGWDYEALLVGSGPLSDGSLGLAWQLTVPPEPRYWQPWNLLHCSTCRQFVFGRPEHFCCYCGRTKPLLAAGEHAVRWATAQNQTQWKSPSS